MIPLCSSFSQTGAEGAWFSRRRVVHKKVSGGRSQVGKAPGTLGRHMTGITYFFFFQSTVLLVVLMCRVNLYYNIREA